MTLPDISIPIHLPIEIPTLLHPPIVHFAVAIPVLILLFEIINLFLKSKSLKITTSLLIALTVLIIFCAYLTGKTDAKVVLDSGTFNEVADLKEHKLLGIYLVYATVIIFVFKLLSLVINKTGFRIFYVFLLTLFVISILEQAEDGGKLVYKYGANVQIQNNNKDKNSLPKVEQKEVQSKKETSKDNQNSIDNNKTNSDTNETTIKPKEDEQKQETQDSLKEDLENNTTESNSTNQ